MPKDEHTNKVRERERLESQRERESPDEGVEMTVSKHPAVFQGCQAHCEALFEMPRLMADIFPSQAAVHYTTLHSDAHAASVPHTWYMCMCVCQ